MTLSADLKKKVSLLMNAVYRGGIPLFQNKQVIADAVISDKKSDTDIRVVTLRFAAPGGVAEQILHAFKTGDVEVLMGDVEPAKGMTPAEVETLLFAFQKAGREVALEPNGMGDDLIQLVTPFKDRNGDPFRFFAFGKGVRKKRKIYLTDAGLILQALRKSGMEPQMGLIQSLLRSYGLVFTQEGVVRDDTDRPMEERVVALFQAWCAADGVMRTWARPE